MRNTRLLMIIYHLLASGVYEPQIFFARDDERAGGRGRETWRSWWSTIVGWRREEGGGGWSANVIWKVFSLNSAKMRGRRQTWTGGWQWSGVKKIARKRVHEKGWTFGVRGGQWRARIPTDFNYGICAGETLNFPAGTCPPVFHSDPSSSPLFLFPVTFRITPSSLFTPVVWIHEVSRFQFYAISLSPFTLLPPRPIITPPPFRQVAL